MTRRSLLCTGLLSLLLPLAAQASDTPAPISVTEGSSRVVPVSAGANHTCALTADGAVACWGADGFGQVDPATGYQPTGTHAGPYLSVSAGGYHTCALTADGAVDCWGNDAYGQVDPAAGEQTTGTRAGPYLSVSAGTLHTCALKADGAVDCWGDDLFGQVDPAAGNQPTGTRAGPYLSVAAGLFHTCALKADGAVDCWGRDSEGQVDPAAGEQTTGTRAGPYLSVSAGSYHTCAMKAVGAVDCWGYDFLGQVDPAAGNQPTGTRAGPYLSVAAGLFHTCALKADGAVDCWGDDEEGQVNPAAGEQTTGTHAGPYLSVAAGSRHTCALKADGAVDCWGAGGEGTSGGANFGQSTVPAALAEAGGKAFGQIAAGNAHACQVKRDGTLSCWGQDTYDSDTGAATPPAGLFTQVVAGDSHSCAIGANNGIICWGRNGASNTYRINQLVESSRQLSPGPNGAICALRAHRDGAECVRAYIGGVGFGDYSYPNITHDVDYNGVTALCGPAWKDDTWNTGNGRGYCLTGFDATHTLFFAGPWQRLESGLKHQCGLKVDGSIECWGTALVDDQLTNKPAATEKFRAFSVGWNHACAIRDNGALACWGGNLNGQATPPAGTYVQVAAGNTFTCAIRSDGVRLCWGDDTHGQAPQLQLTPASVADGALNTAHAGATFVLGDFGQNADGDYVPPTPAFAVVDGALPAGMSLSAAGVLSGTPTASGGFTFTVEGEDANGLVASRAYTFNVIGDPTPPVISYTANGVNPPAPDGDNDWFVGDVAIGWTVTDAESAISSTGCTASMLNTDSAGATYTCSATSAGGTSSLTTASIKRDATKPIIVAAATTSPNANGWYTGNVIVHFTCTDGLSGVASCTSDQTLTASGSSTAQTATDNAGNVSDASNVVTVQIDATAPVISYTLSPPSPNGSNGWYVGNVSIDWTITDPESGIASSTGCNDVTLLADTANASYICTATNAAGTTSSVSTVNIKRDATAPTLAPTVPSPILLGGSYAASPNAADALSGLASASCGALNTSTTGSKSTTCSATDNAGNSRTVTLNYMVSTTCSNDGYSGTQLTWCRNICENGLSGQVLDTWIHRWVSRYRDLPYCRVAPQPPVE